MINFLKKFVVFSRTSNGNIGNDEISSITDEEAIEFYKTLPIDSLLDLTRKSNEIYLQKGLFSQIDGFIACIGKPGQGKSSLCSAFYKTLYGLNKEIFSISDSTLSFTKGLWIIKEKERRSIKENILKDIIDVEGFQVDDLSTWKYIMIVAFISTDIIVVNRSTRLDEVKKIMNIIWNSLEKMKKLGLPKILKTIWVQIVRKKQLEKFHENMESIDSSCEKWKEKSITVKPVMIHTVEASAMEDANDNILEVKGYLEEVKAVFEKIQKENMGESVSTLLRHIDNFNKTMNGKNTFNMENLKNEIKKDFDNYYLIEKNKKENKLLQKYKKDDFIPPINSKESFNDFINKQNIDFSFQKNEVQDHLTFYGSSNEFDEIYEQFMNEKDYKVDPSIFKFIYESLINKVKVEEQIENDKKKLEEEKLNAENKKKRQEELIKKKNERQNAYFDFENSKMEINSYFSKLKFYDSIDSYTSYKYNINGNYDDETKKYYNDQLKSYYYEKEKEKKKEWENQIERSKYKTAVQCYGEMKCNNGHEFSDDRLGCGGCKKKKVNYEDRLLYWVDGDAQYVICHHCKDVFYINDEVECGNCGAKCQCKVKWKKGYRP